MKIDKDLLITLENDDKYAIIDKITYENREYYISAKVNEKEEVTSELAILEEIVKEDGVYLNRITDPDLIVILTREYKKSHN